MKATTVAPQTTKIFIAAKTYGHASHCAKLAKLGPRDWLYVDDGHRLKGTRGAKVILYETWREHPRVRDIEMEIKYRECVTEPANG